MAQDQKLHSITKFIPLTPQTDPNNFPRGEYHPYPRMMVQKNDKPFTTPQGKPVIVQDEDEEAAFRAEHPDAKEHPQSGASMVDELAQLRAENEKLRAAAGNVASTTKPPSSGAGVASLVQQPKADDKPETDGDANARPAATSRKTGRRLD